MTAPDRPGVRLQVARARPHDVGRGAARLSPEALRRLGLEEGDVVEVVGKRRTAALALRLPFEDRGLDLLRLDGLQRANAGVGIGESVEVRAAHAHPAERITLAPAPGAPPAGSVAALRRALVGRAMVAGDLIAATDGAADHAAHAAIGLRELRLRVTATSPDGVVRVVDATAVECGAEPAGPEAERRIAVSYDDLGGLGDALSQVREMVELPLRHPELFHRLGIDPPRGLLLHGPPGTGKTLLARAVANEADADFFYVGGPEVMGPHVGEGEERLRAVFARAAARPASIVFIDELDAIAPKREGSLGDAERRLVAQLLTLMDGLEPRRNVVVIGATNLPDLLDEALRRPGRFDRELAVGVPDRAGRREILAIHARGMPLAADVSLDELARTTAGFVGADLAALAREAAMAALRRSLTSADLEAPELPAEVVERLEVTRADFADAARRVRPSALRELVVQVPEVRWSDVGGLDDAKRLLREGIELPLRHPDAFRRLGVRAARGFLLFGPPGTGKTLLAKAAASESEANFIAAKSSDLLSRWYGESERQLSRLFARARQAAPALIFLDELDALAPARGSAGESAATERVVNTLLAEMDGLEALEGVVVIGATNRPGLLDSALLRPGRFDELIYVPVPDRDGRLHVLRVLTASMPLADDVDLAALAERTGGYTGADLEGLVRRAGLEALRDHTDVCAVATSCFERALAGSRPSVTPEMEREYEALLDELKREGPFGRRRIGFVDDRGGAGA